MCISDGYSFTIPSRILPMYACLVCYVCINNCIHLDGERREEAVVHVLVCHALEVASVYR